MRVFVTGATGHIGSALVPELLQAGHDVLGLARSNRSAAALEAAGAQALRGSLEDLDVLRHGAAASDGVIHLAFRHDLSFSGDMVGAAAIDLRAINVIGDALAGTEKPLVGTSGTLLLAFAAPGRPGQETDTLESGPRVESENAVVALAQRGVRSSVVRLAPSVHSSLDRHGFVPQLIRMAQEHGVSPYVDDGSNRWPAVHTLDAARLFRLALETAPAGSRLHGAADHGVPFREIAMAIGHQLNLPVVSISRQQTGDHFDWLASFVSLDNPTSNALTRKLVGWQPVHPGLIEDLEHGQYFEAVVSV
jgi:nucleoside-diphosphate-sugar epimerase